MAKQRDGTPHPPNQSELKNHQSFFESLKRTWQNRTQLREEWVVRITVRRACSPL
jgi:hypothetical protein